jgi:hypothetical protein
MGVERRRASIPAGTRDPASDWIHDHVINILII